MSTADDVEAPEDITDDITDEVIRNGIFPTPMEKVSELLDNAPVFPGEIKLDVDGKLLKQYLTYTHFAKFLVDIYDDWIRERLPQQITYFVVELPRNKRARFENIQVIPPRYAVGGKNHPLFPQKARSDNLTYSIEFLVDMVLYKYDPLQPTKEEKIDQKPNIPIGSIPCMYGSSHCYTRGKSDDELRRMGEDPADPKGYFIVAGTEKVVVLQEQMRPSRIYMYKLTTKSGVVCRLGIPTPKGTCLMQMVLGKKRSVLKLQLQSLRKNKKNVTHSIPVLVFFRLFGINDLNEILKIISYFLKPESSKKVLLELTWTIAKLASIPDDYEYIARKMGISSETLQKEMEAAKKREEEEIKGRAFERELRRHEYIKETISIPSTKEEQMARVQQMLDNDFFPHMNGMPKIYKIYMLSMMIASMAEFMAGVRKLDDRDSWSNKRLQSGGAMMEQLFRNLWKRMIVKNVQEEINKGNIRDFSGITLQHKIITEEFLSSFISPNWGDGKAYAKTGVVQPLENTSNKLAAYDKMLKVDVDASRNGTMESVRLVQMSQYNIICPAETPEGQNCGISKSLAMTAQVTSEMDDDQIINLLSDKTSSEPMIDMKTILIINGKFFGWCHGEDTKKFCVSLRRDGTFTFMTIVLQQDRNILSIYTDGGRPMAPLLIVGENGWLEIDNKNLWGRPVEELLSSV